MCVGERCAHRSLTLMKTVSQYSQSHFTTRNSTRISTPSFLWGFSGPFAWFTKAGKVPFTTYYCIWIARYIICLVCLAADAQSIHIFTCLMFSKVVYFLYFSVCFDWKCKLVCDIICLVLLQDGIHTYYLLLSYIYVHTYIILKFQSKQNENKACWQQVCL